MVTSRLAWLMCTHLVDDTDGSVIHGSILRPLSVPYHATRLLQVITFMTGSSCAHQVTLDPHPNEECASWFTLTSGQRVRACDGSCERTRDQWIEVYKARAMQATLETVLRALSAATAT